MKIRNGFLCISVVLCCVFCSVSVDLIQKMKEFMPAGTKFDPAIFKTVKTVQDVVDVLVPYMG